MPNSYFQFKQFVVHQEGCSMKVTTDACLFGAWTARQLTGKYERILDIGTGTGLLSLMMAQSNTAPIDAIEIQKTDFTRALANVKASPWSQQIKVLYGDVLEYGFDTRYDVIVSNPPFYEADLKGTSAGRNIAHHDEGLSLHDLAGALKKQLQFGGLFFLLFPAKREAELADELGQCGLFINRICFVQQTAAHSPFRIMVKGSFTKVPAVKQRILIRSGKEYSPEFTALLKPYYLHM
ncbi:methyltransferase [Niabella ginsenosidivorans]|uniref:tRNA1(Val) (adenine(37)-N6)-methyltransferase n=1 Tax=Niabella ginsenosidivorans TaxID=1176587 RepID=A0A1A9I2J4_9BACT|nr:methyltransferase [Niabella ginsenosidivorans]ANH81753.1 methyltransferase [Niabella ginsenosidivorans]